MISNLSDTSKDVLKLAISEARNTGQYYIGVEHVLLALCQSADAALIEIVNKYNLDSTLGNRVRSTLRPEEGEPIWGYEFIQTPRVQRILDLASKICIQTQSESVFPTHLMLAIFLEGRSIPCRFLKESDLDPSQIVLSLKNVLRSQDQQAKVDSVYRRTPYLNNYGRDLTYLASKGKLDPTIGRQKDIQEMIYILKKKVKNSPMIIGAAGVGKTHLVEGLSQEIISQENENAKALQGRRVIEIDLNSLVAGTMYRGDFEARLENIIKEAIQEHIILFIDEFHTIMKAGSASGAYGAAQILKPYLSRGDIQCIGATTPEGYSEFVEGDKAMSRRFEIIQLNEPNIEETLNILKGIKASHEAHHNVRISDDALKAAVDNAARYISDRCFPDKAIDLLDSACAKRSLGKAEVSSIGPEDIGDIIFQRYGIRIQPKQNERAVLMNLADLLSERVIGQDEAISIVVNSIRNARMGLSDPRRPEGVFLLCGPTGVGKTELVRVLGDILFGDEKAIIRVDMSEYMEPHTVSRLIGAPPGYVGYNEGGILTEAVRRKPYSVILLDEIEKAHPDICNILLQVFEDGRLTDGRGRTADFSNTVIFMTSNIGTEQWAKKHNIGFAGEKQTSTEKSYECLKKIILKELGKAFKPEFRNRIDSIIVFKTLTESVVRRIIDKFLCQTHDRPGLRDRNITLKLGESAYQTLMKYGYSEEMGAREMSRAIQTFIIDPLGMELIQHDIPRNSTLYVEFENDRAHFIENKDSSIG